MEEAKYTPATWWVDEFSDGDVRIVVDPLKGMPPPIIDGRTFVCKMYQNDARGIDAITNARLISAAPDLLEAAQAALHEMCNTIAPRNSFTDAVDKLDAAISKAIGK